jgi:FkbM family methyltransferase
MRLVRRAGEITFQVLTCHRFYQTWQDSIRANWLRLTENRFARRWLAKPGSRSTLHLKDYDAPIFVRRGNSDFLVVHEIFEEQEYAPVMKMNLRPDANILDLGANVGLMAIYLAVHFPASRIASVEPDADNRQLLCDNCAPLLKTGRLQVFEGFVAAKDGFASIDRKVMGGMSWAFQKSEGGVEKIPCFSIPTLCQKMGFDRIDLLKCDVEGTEAELFGNCSEWIGRVRNLVVETHSAAYGPEHVQADLRAAGWNFRVAGQVRSLTFLSNID